MIDDEIHEAIAEYLSIIRTDHHKSRDLVFLIEKRFEFDVVHTSQTYIVSHPGYVNEFSREFKNAKDAHAWMLLEIKRCIRKERISIDEAPSESR